MTEPTRPRRTAPANVNRQAPPTWISLLLAAFCLGVAILVPEPLVQWGLVAFAICLSVLACLGLWRPSLFDAAPTPQAPRASEILEDAVRELVGREADPAFLTGEDDDVLFANTAAIERFGKDEATHLATAFGSILANPEVVLYRLQARCQSHRAAKEDVTTRNGVYRISVVRISEDRFLWRLDEKEKSERASTRATDQLSLPMMTVGASGAVLYMNDAFRTILGTRPKSLHDVVEDPTIANGQIAEIKSVDGPRPMLLAVFSGLAGRREIYALPADDVAHTPRPLPGGWDAIEDLPVPLAKLTSKGVILAVNREARLLLGAAAREGARIDDLLDGLGRPVREWLKEALSGKIGHSSEFLRGRGANSETFVQVTLNPSDDDGMPHLIAVLNDVTELKTLEAQFVQSQKMQAIGQLAGGVAHDFNNLLTAISGHCDLLLLRHDQGDQDYGDLIQIHQNANRAAALVGQLLAFSRKQNLQSERIDLRDTLSDLTHLLNRLVGEKVRLVLDHDPDLACIKADKRQLEQVMMNLVVNARDAMPSGGEIHVKTENMTLEEPLIRDRATVPAGDYVVVRVTDEGHGIPPERLPKIFEPFYTTKRTGEGTGLGLSTVYGIVKQTGGYIFAKSDVSRGTMFELMFPAHTLQITENMPVVIEQPTSRTLTGDGVVLLVEDEAPVRAFASRALQLRGFTVLEADSAEAALDLLSDPDLSIDVFVTDVIMPGKDGPTWVREALIERPGTKVVFVSGYAEDAFSESDDRIPNAVFLPKPFSLNELTNTVQGQLH